MLRGTTTEYSRLKYLAAMKTWVPVIFPRFPAKSDLPYFSGSGRLHGGYRRGPTALPIYIPPHPPSRAAAFARHRGYCDTRR